MRTVLCCAYQHEKWYFEKLREEAEWEDQVEKEVKEAAAGQAALQAETRTDLRAQPVESPAASD